jgi:uncharacterized protein (TIGR00730 family)
MTGIATASAAPASRAPTLCVFCGSRFGADARYLEAARELGRAVGARGWELVYGGGRVGLMGAVADAALAAGARVSGVIPDSLMRREVGHAGLHELLVVDTMHERKRLMAERADAFVALPGGIGTFEELFEVWTWRQLGYHDKPVALLNVAGYYDQLLQFMTQVTAQEFVSESQMHLLQVSRTVDELFEGLAAEVAARRQAADFSRI